MADGAEAITGSVRFVRRFAWPARAAARRVGRIYECAGHDPDVVAYARRLTLYVTGLSMLLAGDVVQRPWTPQSAELLVVSVMPPGSPYGGGGQSVAA